MSDPQPLLPDPSRKIVIEYDPLADGYILSQNDFERIEAIGILEVVKLAIMAHECDESCHEQNP